VRRIGIGIALGVALALATAGAPAAADEAPAKAGAEARAAELALEEVLASTERSFPLLRAAELDRSIAAADVRTAEGGFDVSWKTKGTVTPVGYYESVRVESTIEKPTTLWGASAFAGYKLGRGAFAGYDGKQETLEYGELRAGVNVPVWRNGPIDRRRANLTKAELGTEIAGLSVAQQRLEIRRAAAHRYWAWVAAGRRLAIAEGLLRIVLDRDGGLGERVARGDLPAVERADNARAIEQRRAQLAAAERALEQAAIELSLYLRDERGAPSLPDWRRLPASFPEPTPEATTATRDVTVALDRRPERRRLELTAEQTRVELAWAKNQRAPGIDVQVAGSQDLGRAIPSRPDLSKPVLEATLLVDVPLQTRAAAGREDAAGAQLAKLAQQQAFQRERIEADVRDAHSALGRARERLGATRAEVRVARELERGERVRFEKGDGHLLFVNLREQQTAEAELREVDALFDWHRATADLAAARGG
jgi:outer membrane protein TolC